MRDFSVGNLITSYRTRLGLKQNEVANPDDPELLSVTLRTYQGWENGERIPSNKWLHRIASFFHLIDAEADEIYRAAAQVAPEIHNLPFPPNPFFTGRETFLEQLDELFQKNDSVAIIQPVSINGLGGIGKTQLALEYAHRHYPKVYRTILWVNAADKASLEASYLVLAHLLKLPEKNERETDRIVQAVKMWLAEHIGWLLILDNADDLQLARSFLPTTPRGQILLTTRSQIVGNIAVAITIEAMELEEGLLFLLRRSGALKHHTGPEAIPSNIRDKATQLVELLGGHPLALDQAGAYIEETGTSFVTYMHLYADQRSMLLNERGLLGDEHPETVLVTLLICFQRACERCPAAADVLHFCCFLHPDDIPEELFGDGDGLNLNVNTFNNAIKYLRRYSLIKRNAEKKVLSLHRLTQAVLRDAMSEQDCKRWVGQVVTAANTVFPNVVRYEVWEQSERLILHVQACATFIKQWDITLIDAASLLDRTGSYLYERGRYSEAEQPLRRALTIHEQILGLNHPDTASSCNNLATLYHIQNRYVEAETLLQRALAIRQQVLKPDHQDIAQSFNALAVLYRKQGKYLEAETLYLQALAIREQVLGPHHLEVASSLNNLATLYLSWGKIPEAEPLYQRALSIVEQEFGSNHPMIIEYLLNLAELYKNLDRHKEAELLYQQAISVIEQVLGPTHPNMAVALNNLAHLYRIQAKYAEAETFYQRALALSEKTFGPSHYQVAASLANLAALLQVQKKWVEAESLYLRAIPIAEQALGSTHPLLATCFHNLALVYYSQGNYIEAGPLCQRALSVREQILGSSNPEFASSLSSLALVYQAQGKYAEAELSGQRALSIVEQVLGANHQNVAACLDALAVVYQAQEKYEEAEPLYQRALTIVEHVFDSSHPLFAKIAEHYSTLLQKTGRDGDVSKLETRIKSVITKLA